MIYLLTEYQGTDDERDFLVCGRCLEPHEHAVPMRPEDFPGMGRVERCERCHRMIPTSTRAVGAHGDSPVKGPAKDQPTSESRAAPRLLSSLDMATHPSGGGLPLPCRRW